MNEKARAQRFEQLLLPHLGAAYNLARWLTRDANDAEDVVQEAYLRAFRFFDGFHGESARAWLLGIVRNTCFTWLAAHRSQETHEQFDENLHGEGAAGGERHADPEALALRREDRQRVNDALASLPVAYREIIVLRELNELSYREIAEVTGLPIGTVMSRLARGRKLLALRITSEHQGVRDEL